MMSRIGMAPRFMCASRRGHGGHGGLRGQAAPRLHSGRGLAGMSRRREGVQCRRRRDAAHACVTCARTQPAPPTGRRRRAGGQGSSVSRRSPRLRVVARRHHEVGAIAAAVGTAEPQVHQRHVAAPRLQEAVQVGVRLVLAAAFAPDEQRDVARSQRCPWRRQAVAVAAARSAFTS